MKLTSQQKADYLSNPRKCPFCKSEEVGGFSVEAENGFYSQEITCYDCGKSWRDIFSLTNVEDT